MKIFSYFLSCVFHSHFKFIIDKEVYMISREKCVVSEWAFHDLISRSQHTNIIAYAFSYHKGQGMVKTSVMWVFIGKHVHLLSSQYLNAETLELNFVSGQCPDQKVRIPTFMCGMIYASSSDKWDAARWRQARINGTQRRLALVKDFENLIIKFISINNSNVMHFPCHLQWVNC